MSFFEIRRDLAGIPVTKESCKLCATAEHSPKWVKNNAKVQVYAGMFQG